MTSFNQNISSVYVVNFITKIDVLGNVNTSNLPILLKRLHSLSLFA